MNTVKICDIDGLFDNIADGTIVARNIEGEKFLWSVNKSRKLYKFQSERNSPRVISKDGRFVADHCPNNTLIVLQKTEGGNFKVFMQLPHVTSFCIENRQGLLSIQNGRDFIIYDLLKKEPIFTIGAGYSCYSIVSESRKFLIQHIWAESNMQAIQIDDGERLDWISCDKVEFIGATNDACIATRNGELLKYNCETGQQVLLTSRKRHVNSFTQCEEFLAVKIGYYTNLNEEQCVQFFKNGVPWTRFDNVDDADYFLTKDILVAIVKRYERDRVPNCTYTTDQTGVLYETNDGWQTCKQIARIENCEAFYLDENGAICAVIDKSTEWKWACTVEKLT